MNRTFKTLNHSGGGGGGEFPCPLIISEKANNNVRLFRLAIMAFLLAGSLVLYGCDNNLVNGSSNTPDTSQPDTSEPDTSEPDISVPNPPPPPPPPPSLLGTWPDDAVARFQSYLSRADFEYLFPNRFGSPVWQQQRVNAGRQAFDYYSYDNLLEAIRRMANIKLRIEYRGGGLAPHSYTIRTIAINRTTGEPTTVIEGGGFNSQWNIGRPINVLRTVYYGSFLASPNANDRRRELAAFLANIGHETTGGWPTAPGGQFAWGLHFNEERDYVGGYTSHYTDHGSTSFPPVPGRSYHGRGPIQLSWNFNYGQMSALLFGDKNYLLENPQRVVECGIIGWQTAIWFWMTPQAPRPSCHDVMVGNWTNWTPSQQDRDTNQTRIGFGHTIMVINGGYEGNLTAAADDRIYSRIGFFRRIAARLDAYITNEKLDTQGMFGQTWF